MDILTPKELKKLALEHSDFCISILMTADNTITADIKNKATLIDLLNVAREKLKSTKLNHEDIEKHLRKGYEIAGDDQVWHDGFRGLAVYLTEGNIFYYKLPFSPKNQVTLSHYFDLLPLVIGYYNNPTYYILLIDEGLLTLYRANAYQIEEVVIKEEFNSEKEYFKGRFDVEEEQMYRTEVTGGRQKNHENIIYHGHGNVKDDQKLRAKNFFQLEAKPIQHYIDYHPAPIILAGHDFLVSIFREIKFHHEILKSSIKINPGPVKSEILHKEANKVINIYLLEQYKKEKAKYCDAINTALTSVWPEEIIRAAKQGQLETLFLNKDIEVFGYLEETEDDLRTIVTNNESDESLSNLALIYALQTDGKVFAQEEAEMPQKVPMCALYRFQ